MDIDITDFFNDAEASNFSASRAEMGENAGKITWANAVTEGTNAPMLTTLGQLDALRDYVRGFGAWDAGHIAGWSDAECNALFIQLVSGDIREMKELCTGDDGEIDWSEVESLSSQGSIAGRISGGPLTIDGRIYFCLAG